MALLDGEDQQLRRIQEKLTLLRQLLQARDLDPENHDPHEWYRIASIIKRALGNFDNDVSFIAALLAKQFLTEHHHIPLLDVSAKAQGAPGLDFDVRSHNGDRIIAELKTTIPYGQNDLGAKQRETFLHDFDKLRNTPADFKYFFVTDPRTYDVVDRRYRSYLDGIQLQLIVDDRDDPEVAPVAIDAPPAHTGPKHSSSGLADSIRAFLREQYFEPARQRNQIQLTVRSGDIHKAMGLRNRYPAVCNTMSNMKLEELCGVSILKTEGNYGANFCVTYSVT